MKLERELQLAIELAVKAGKEIMKVYNRTFEVEYKEDDSPLTEADKASNDIIVPALKKASPEYAVLSEEEKDDLTRLENDYCWVIDPLDGTKEFVKRNGEFTVNIALSFQQRVVLGVIYVPVSGELYYASEGNGAFYQSKDMDMPEKIEVTDRTEDIRLVMSRSHASDELKELIDENNIDNVVKSGSSLKGALIARGQAEVYYRFNPTMEWDTAAMQCIVEEAGGILRQMDGTEMLYNRENSLNDKGFYVVNCEENMLN
ncbi:MAG: 3'(2'),5'-bisphosphate nucleotidase CysQ [Halanaerobiaceae bacterium]